MTSMWCIAKNGGGYTQTGVAKGLMVPCLFMIAEVSIRCQKKPWRLVYGVYPRIPPNTPLHILCARVATFSLFQPGTGVLGAAPSRWVSHVCPMYDPRKTFGILYVIWSILVQSGGSYVGRRTWYICNFAIKIEPICHLQCPHDCTAVLPLLVLSNEHALKSGTFGVPGLVLLGRRITWHKSGKSETGGTLLCAVTSSYASTQLTGSQPFKWFVQP